MSTTAVYPKCAKCGREIVGTALIFYGSNRIWHPECLASSPSPASPADDVAGLIADAKLLRDAVHEYNRGAHGLDTHESELWAIADRIENAAAALSRLQAELDKALQTIEVWDSDREAAKANWVKHGATEIALGQWRARAENAEARLAEVTAERDFERSERRRVSDLCDQTEHERAVAEAELAKVRQALPPFELHPVADGGGRWHYELRVPGGTCTADASAATMREALIDCQRVLALLADRHAAVSAPNVVSIWAQTVAAEAKARAALGGQHG